MPLQSLKNIPCGDNDTHRMCILATCIIKAYIMIPPSNPGIPSFKTPIYNFQFTFIGRRVVKPKYNE